MEQKPRWNWVITLAAVFLAFCLGFGVARWTQHTDGVTVRTARTVPHERSLPCRPSAAPLRQKSTAAPTSRLQPQPGAESLDLNRATAQELTTLPRHWRVLAQHHRGLPRARGYRSVEELIAVEGIPARASWKSSAKLVTVEEEP